MAFNVFATATSAIPLADLDANFTAIGTSAVASTLYPAATTSITYGAGATNHIFNTSGNLLVGCTATDSGAQFRFQYGSGQNGLQLFDNTNTSGSLFTIFGYNTGSGLSNAGTIARNGADNAILVNGTSYLALGSGGTERMRINSSGNVGIGTTSPGAALVVKVATNANFAVQNTSGHLQLQGINDAGTAFAQLDLAGSFITFSPAAVEAVRIDASGNLGIGTTSPGQKLTVQSVGSSTAPQLKLQNPVDSNSSQGAANSLSAGQLLFGATGSYPLTAKIESLYNADASFGRSANLVFYNAAGDGTLAERMRIDVSGNLGIGITPSAWYSTIKAIDIASTGSFAAATDSTYVATNAYVDSGTNWHYKSNAVATSYIQNAGQHSWNTAAAGGTGTFTFTQAMTLDASGNLLVGATATNAGAKAYVNFSTAAGANGLLLTDSSNSSGTTFAFFIETGVGQIGSISRVGTTAAVIYNTSSDYRLKTVLGSVSGSGERIDALKPIDYQWTEDGSNARGFLAHEFKEVYANSVTGEKDAVDADGKPVYQAMQAGSSEVIADLVAEIQSLRARVAQLETKGV